MQFQKISIPTPWKVNGNSEGVGGLKSQNFKRKVWGLSGNSRGVGGGGGLNQKTFCGRGMDILWNNTILVKSYKMFLITAINKINVKIR